MIESCDAAGIQRVMPAVMPMTKLEIGKLQQAFDGH
jgi:hypothetical protein